MFSIEKILTIPLKFKFKTIPGINIVVERIPCYVWTSNSLSLTMLMLTYYWLIENQSLFTNESRNAMVLTYDFLIYSEVIREIMHLFPSYNEKGV